MARSKAKKQRLKQSREGKRNPELDRMTWILSPVERRTPSFEEKRRRMDSKHKRKWNREPGDGGTVPFFVAGNKTALHSPMLIPQPAVTAQASTTMIRRETLSDEPFETPQRKRMENSQADAAAAR